jgi:hypothetical protein
LKKTKRHQHLQTKELNKIIEFSGFFGKKIATWQPKKKLRILQWIFLDSFAKFAIF